MCDVPPIEVFYHDSDAKGEMTLTITESDADSQITTDSRAETWHCRRSTANTSHSVGVHAALPGVLATAQGTLNDSPRAELASSLSWA